MAECRKLNIKGRFFKVRPYALVIIERLGKYFTPKKLIGIKKPEFSSYRYIFTWSLRAGLRSPMGVNWYEISGISDVS